MKGDILAPSKRCAELYFFKNCMEVAFFNLRMFVFIKNLDEKIFNVKKKSPWKISPILVMLAWYCCL